MKIFESEKGNWGEKVNFVDENNVLVGYDMAQDCCENAGWFLSLTEDNEIKENAIDEVEGYYFDTEYFMDVDPKRKDCYSCLKVGFCDSCIEEGGIVRFRLLCQGKPDVYLHLYNSHNGYYGHGFTAEIGGQNWKCGTL